MAQDAITELAELLEGKGSRRYGLSDVNQLQHALQAALLAEQSGCSAACKACCNWFTSLSP